MKKLYIILFISILFVFSCEKNSINDQALELNDTSWTLKSITISDDVIIYSDGFIIWDGLEEYTLGFEEDSIISGQISTNTYHGTFNYDFDGSIEMAMLAKTKKGEPSEGYSDDFWIAMKDVSSYELENNKLNLYYNQNKSILNFVRE